MAGGGGFPCLYQNADFLTADFGCGIFSKNDTVLHPIGELWYLFRVLTYQSHIKS
jgi:hypothetical protein